MNFVEFTMIIILIFMKKTFNGERNSFKNKLIMKLLMKMLVLMNNQIHGIL